MQYGYFDKKKQEYVITRFDTPTPWINYLGSNEYCAMISNTGGGYSFHLDPRDKRLTRYRYNNLPYDRPGRYIYIRDNKTKDYWSATAQPVTKDPKKFKYECRHGLGYTKINSQYSQIESKTTYFVPLNDNLEVWHLTLKNKSSEKRELSVFSYIEFCLWHAVSDMSDFQYTLNIARAHLEDNVIYHLTGYYPHLGAKDFVYFGTSQKPDYFDTDREVFIGAARSEATPLSVERGKCANSVAAGGNPIGAHQINITLEPGEEKILTFVLGTDTDKKKAAILVKKYSNPSTLDQEFKKLAQHWEECLNRYSIDTPDEDVDLMVNTWNAYQCRTTFNWSRSASFYESGIGRGMGFRDSNQDTLGVVHSIPKKVKQRIKDLAANQFARGDAFHQYFPLTKEGNAVGYSDDHLWLIVSTTSYIKETGDVAFLKEKVGFAVYPEGEKKAKSTGTMYEHLTRAIDSSFKNVGKHGIPLLGYADWNDCINKIGDKAESVWVAEFFVYTAKLMAELCEFIGKKEDAKKFAKKADTMQARINKHAWDGAWYVRAFNDEGKAFGSHKSKEGQIYLNAQSWAVMADIADKNQLKECMNNVKKMLNTDHGVMLMTPAYTKFDPKIGAIGTFLPGLKENGGIFCHANPWAVIAETKLGRGETSFEYYKKTAPATRNKVAAIHKTEPYIYSQFIAGRSHPDHGRARNSWLTGAASWNFVGISQYILGVRADYKGLVVDPCIPKIWKKFSVKRVFRGATYDIKITNPGGVNKGIKKITVDGKKIQGNIIPPATDKKTKKIKVVMG